LAFAVVFQKAIFESWLIFLRFSRSDLATLEHVEYEIDDLDEEPGEPEESLTSETSGQDFEDGKFAHINALTDRFLGAMNRIVSDSNEFLDVGFAMSPAVLKDAGVTCQNGKFWSGALLDIGADTIDFSDRAATRAGHLLFVLVAMITYDNLNEPGIKSDFDSFWNRMNEDDAPNLLKKIHYYINKMMSETKNSGQAHRIINALDQDFEDPAEAKLSEMRARLSYIWHKLEL
jgi:hypothetical protein